MEKVAITCKDCGALATVLVNLWLKIGKSYVSPAIAADKTNLVDMGSARLGEEGTLVAGCHLQDVACQCNAVIGLKCIDCPVNHVFHQGQLMLRLASVAVMTPDLQEEAEIMVQRTLKLKEPTGRSATDDQAPNRCRQGDEPMPDDAFCPRNSIHLGHLQAEVAGHGEVLKRLDSAGYQIVATFNDSVLRIEREVQSLRDDMSSLQKDPDLHHTKSRAAEDEISKIKTQLMETRSTSEDTRLDKLEEAINTAKTAIAGVREELSARLNSPKQNSSAESRAVGSGLEEARGELQTLREELQEVNNVAKEGVAAAQGYAKEARLLRSEVK